MKTTYIRRFLLPAFFVLSLAACHTGADAQRTGSASEVSDKTLDIDSISAIPNGLRIVFTQPVDRDWLADPLNYHVTQPVGPGLPGHERADLQPVSGQARTYSLTHLRPVPSGDGASVDLYIDGLTPGRIVHVRFAPPNTNGEAVPPTEATYTLDRIPQKDRTAEYFGDPPDDTHPWAQHDPQRPMPPMADPMPDGPTTTPPPDGAVVLFDGNDLSRWQDEHGEPSTWIVEDGTMRPGPRSGYIYSKEKFGDVRMHLEWFCPASETKDRDQKCGNSGVFLMSEYEVQVLETKENVTYADGMAAAIYGQTPPIVNAGLGPDRWQSYDITFRRPRFNDAGKLLEPARVTVHHNGVLVQDNTAYEGPTQFKRRTRYQPHPDHLPIALQDHGDPVRFRNIWVKPLE